MHGCPMSGDNTCWLCGKHRKADWLKFEPLSISELMTLETVRANLQIGAACAQFTKLPDVLLGDGETPVDERGMKFYQGEPDYLLHHRTGLIKTYLFWAIVNLLSAKKKELIRRKFEEVFGWKTFMEYMNGHNWLLVLLKWDEVLLPFVENYQTEFLLVRFHLLEIIVILSYDHGRDEHSRRTLSLAIHGHCLALRLVMINMHQREIYTGNLSLFAHQVFEHLAPSFEKKDIADHVCQRLEAMFKNAKYVVQHNSDKKEYSRAIVTRENCIRRRETRFRSQGRNIEVHESTNFREYRSKNPLGNITIPSYLFTESMNQLNSYVESVLQGSSFGFAEGEDYTLTGEALVFHVANDTTEPPSSYSDIVMNYGLLPSPGPPATDQKTYKTMDTPSLENLRDMYFEGRTNELENLNVTSLQAILYQICKAAISGLKKDLVERIRHFMKERFGKISSFIGSSLSASRNPIDVMALPSLASPAMNSFVVSDSDPSGTLNTSDFIDIICEPSASCTLNELQTNVGFPIEFCWRCLDLSYDHVDNGCAAKVAFTERPCLAEIGRAATNHILGIEPGTSWLVSLSIDVLWCLYLASKTVQMRGHSYAAIAEVSLQEIRSGVIIDASSVPAAMKSGVNGGKARAWSACASEVLVQSVSASAMTGRVLVVSLGTEAGKRLLSIGGKDRERSSGGRIIVFGSFPEWKKSFETEFATQVEVERLINELQWRGRRQN